MFLTWFMLVSAFAAFFLTWVLRRYALHRSLIDVPNSRSSHSVPTPRGGGVAIVLSFLTAIFFLGIENELSWSFVYALSGAGAGVAVLGFLDDHGHIAARWRLLGHFIAAIWALFWLNGLPIIDFAYGSINLGWIGHVLAAFYLVWMLNLYNFMDGIDGIASVEAICVCLGASLIYWVAGYESLLAAPLLLVMAVAGFLYWNFPPARIFMGDAGSGFLGIILGLLSLQAAWFLPKLLWVWLILLGVFIVDASVTLLRRLVRGDKIYEAHRSHAYQFASRQYGSHLPVTLVVVAINMFWLLPMAACVALWDLDGSLALVLAYVPLVWLALKFHAGMLEKS
ncbi:glycosyltransferase family 4 protein [Pseudomonas corrugata]|uniref:Glycosyltransferase family 4 protein n=1 Tax=Pseudomonas corrugata TaxID=47879 RepID=A0A7Y5Z963_9PSED|nr:glycosyltransferase family 4 protein [Pseudomonas corrugata]MDU9037521.1 glycosyltransferase family 4 protein [Pseudomonas corrugata]NUT87878.1 glycosyltransferase family 4 protein [Pseudomonas corrugata]